MQTLRIAKQILSVYSYLGDNGVFPFRHSIGHSLGHPFGHLIILTFFISLIHDL